jgi:SAM-dependent methyltransferase
MRNETDWSFLAQRYQGILPSLSSYLANRAALLYVSSLAEAGTISFPEKGLSVGSGTGDLYDASQELEPMLVRAGQSRPAVTDLDFSAEMLRLSRNPDKVCAPASSIPLNDNSYDLAECSSPYRMGSGADLKSILGEIHRVVRPGGVLWLKADGILFSDSFAASLERMGFDFIAPANSTLCLPPEIVEGLDPKLRQRSLAALKNTHFILAVKSTRTPQEVDATSLTFMRKRTVSEDVEEVQNLLKGLLRSATDNEYIINARTFVGTMSTLAPETFDHKGALAVGLLHKYLGVLFTHDEIGVLPAKRDVVSLHSKLLEHQRLVDGSLRETDQPNTDPDSIVLYVREMKRAVDHLEQLAAQASQ